jgi:hypothetical protein
MFKDKFEFMNFKKYMKNLFQSISFSSLLYNGRISGTGPAGTILLPTARE